MRVATAVQRPAARQLAKFAAVGVTNTLVSFATYAALIALGLHYVPASVIAFLTGAMNSYRLNRVWTFRAGGFTLAGWWRYVCVQAGAVGLNALLLVTLVEDLRVDRLLAQALVLPAVSATSFAATRTWVFPQRPLVTGD